MSNTRVLAASQADTLEAHQKRALLYVATLGGAISSNETMQVQIRYAEAAIAELDTLLVKLTTPEEEGGEAD